MKIILSRKGFDSASAGCPNPILPDGTLLSMPIPSDDAVKYSDLRLNDYPYDRVLSGLKSRSTFTNCHLDPDIRDGIRVNQIDGWKPAFGQTGSPLGILRNAGVGIGDIFLFFGLFCKTEDMGNGSIGFVKKEKAIQVIYGYMQIGEILEKPELISQYPWHPHATSGRYNAAKNALYIPSDYLTLHPSMPGYGVFSYRDDRVLTKSGENAATWEERDFLMPFNVVGNRKNCSKGSGIYYAGQWQELVLKPNPAAEKWVAGLMK